MTTELHFGRCLATALRRRGWSHRDLARRLGVTRQHVSYLCRAPSWQWRTVRRVARALGVDPGVFLGLAPVDWRAGGD